MVELFNALGITLGASWSAGVRLYGTVAALGLAHRFGFIELPGELGVISHLGIITLASALAVAEVLSDKFPIVDSALDTVNTVMKPIGGGALSFLALGDAGPMIQTAAGVLGGSVSLTTHAVKATSRAAINASPEPVSNIVTSTAEDGLALGGIWMILTNPFVMAVLVVLFLIFAVWFLKKMFKFLKKVFGFFFKSSESPPPNTS